MKLPHPPRSPRAPRAITLRTALFGSRLSYGNVPHLLHDKHTAPCTHTDSPALSPDGHKRRPAGPM